ncbi:hypothetical protein [Acidocella sp.]|uniref:hypothetical protein n=1 Tax=Acidocella sp. TaxID=50710 RepID=UPI00261540B4|nr:hypothetical protein [Acidocella sp.]
MDENLAKDFVAVWQSELAAMAADRELREQWIAMLNLWERVAAAAAVLWSHEAAPRGPGPAQPPRAAPAAAASGHGMDEIERLSRRVDDLEQRLAELLERWDSARPGGVV